MIGKTLGKYHIIEQLGAGGMATVYKAHDPDTDRFVALKVLDTRYSQNPKFRQRFRREAKAIAQLEHLHILPVHDYGEENGIAYLVMRCMEAGTLADRLEEGPLPLDEANRLLGQIASALDAAHQRGLIHRDVKPNNVLLDAQGNAYLTDFGIARMVEGVSDAMTETGTVFGTPAYMSVEQCRGARDLTPATDIYSLGVVLYYMVTGSVPFDAETPLAVIRQHINDPLPPPRTLRPDLPERAEAVIFRATAKAPEGRYRSAGAMAAAFAQALGITPLSQVQVIEEAPPASADEGTPTIDLRARPRWRKRAPIAAGVVGLVLLGAVVAALLAGDRLSFLGARGDASGGGAIDPGSSVTGRLDSFDDAHNWTFAGTQGDIVLIYVAAEGDSDPLASLIDPDGNVTAEDDDGGTDRDAYITATLPSTGTYTIRVRTYVPGSYTLSLDTSIVAPPLPEFDGGDGLETSGGGAVDFGSSVTNRLHSLLEAHNWTFEGKSGQVVSIYVASDGDSDPRARLIDPDGQVIAEDDDGGENLDAAIDTTLPITGTYIIRVDAHTSGAYTLTLE